MLSGRDVLILKTAFLIAAERFEAGDCPDTAESFRALGNRPRFSETETIPGIVIDKFDHSCAVVALSILHDRIKTKRVAEIAALIERDAPRIKSSEIKRLFTQLCADTKILKG